jgi:DNA-binding response OmpR family regulator
MSFSTEVRSMAMRQNPYGDVRAVLCETNPALRSGLQAALYGKGLREVMVCKDVTSLATTLHDDLIDLVVCDVNLPGLDFCDMAQRLRQNAYGRNPFTLLIATLSDASVNEVRRMINAGVDRVLRKPVPMNVIMDHIDALVDARKPFVATEGYVGPTRRAAPRKDESWEELVPVPNTLRSKIVEKTNDDRLQMMVEEGWAKLEEMKAFSSTASINRLINRILAHYDGNGSAETLRTDLNRLVAVSRNLMRRSRGSADHIVGLTSSLISVTVQIAQSPQAPQRVHLQLLAKLGEVIRRTISAKQESIEVIQKIAETVERFSGPAPGERLN